MKKNLSKLKKGCELCFSDAKRMNKQLGNRKSKDLNFEEAKKIFSPLKDKINHKN